MGGWRLTNKMPGAGNEKVVRSVCVLQIFMLMFKKMQSSISFQKAFKATSEVREILKISWFAAPSIIYELC